MSEAIISRRGWTDEGKPQLRTEIITSNVNWQVPKLRGNNTVSVLIFGGGGYVQNGCGGSGWMNNGEFTNLTPGTNIRITIGKGGTQSNNVGGTTSFGTYLSALGGNGINGGSGGYSECRGGDGYQFGGGGGAWYNYYSSGGDGGNGGTYGGGGGRGGFSQGIDGGDGGTYGGGGGGGYIYAISSSPNKFYVGGNGGNGGTYGGGGSGGFAYLINLRDSTRLGMWSLNKGIGGTYGGNGGEKNINAENGTNTIGRADVPVELRGAGIGYTKSIHVISGWYSGNFDIIIPCGGGGFGGNGGTYKTGDYNINNSNGTLSTSVLVAGGGCGGGGYGGDGGNGCTPGDSGLGCIFSTSGWSNFGAGGGGGFGGRGADGTTSGSGGGGGGYYSNAIGRQGGGYFNYCMGSGTLGGKQGGSGGCIIQYYI